MGAQIKVQVKPVWPGLLALRGPVCRLHDLRHYVATRLLAAGVDVRTVAGRLGHRNASTTLNVSSHCLAETDREAANVLGLNFDDAVTAGGVDPVR